MASSSLSVFFTSSVLSPVHLTVGFFYGVYSTFLEYLLLSCLQHAITVKNHGVPEDLTSKVVDAGKRFFSLPLASKTEVQYLSPFPFSYILRSNGL